MQNKKLSIPKADGRRRAVIEGVSPQIDAGLFPIKRTIGERVVVEADIFADGHDALAAVLQYRNETEKKWTEVPMLALGNDRWRAAFNVDRLGTTFYTIEAWMDPFTSWRRDLEKRVAAGVDLSVDLRIGAALVREAVERGKGAGTRRLKASAARLDAEQTLTVEERVRAALDPALVKLMAGHPDRRCSTKYQRELRVAVDPVLARFGAWYEMFPRSVSSRTGPHGTFRDCAAQLPRIAELGFDVLYFPPIHPIGRSFRKGRNNNPIAKPGDAGSPWAIGAAEGGHKSVLPELGTLDDFRRLVQRAREMKIEIALDIAFQCAPDHPYVQKHPEWFRKRPDGTIQYAENPPKKYQDIYPFDFDSEDWQALWHELKSVFEFWIEQGVRLFRVDNPHTKSFPFWTWCIAALRDEHPDLIFLAEAFTRPRVMYRLAKLGYNQSYNYFPWRNGKEELTEYFQELTRTDVSEYFRPNLWPNTPDILTQYLQYGGRAAFVTRLILAATLGASYGIYGPAFELCLDQSRELGSEEYLDSEKYEIKRWSLDRPGNLEGLIAQINRLRRANPALHSNQRLEFHPIDNPQLIAYSKSTEDLENIILTVVNLDPHYAQAGWTQLDLTKLGIGAHDTFQVHDLVTDERYLWQGPRNYVELNPRQVQAHVFRVRRRVRREQDVDYFA